MGLHAKRIAFGAMVATGWLVAASAWASGWPATPADSAAAPWAKAGLGTQVIATMVLWAGQKRHDDRLKVIEQVISTRPCILKHCEVSHRDTRGRS